MTRNGLGAIRDYVATYFTQHEIPATVPPLGLKNRSLNITQFAPGGGNRICFIPGKFDGQQQLKPREFGTLSRDTYGTLQVYEGREILGFSRLNTISIWASPPNIGADEGAMLEVAEDLLEKVIRAVQEAGMAAIGWQQDVFINSPPNESSYGLELLVYFTIDGPLLSETLDVVQASPGLTVTMGQ